ncbi:MAG: hypothetical protein VW440_04650 [Bordetella sp.]
MANLDRPAALRAFCKHPLDPKTSSDLGLAFAASVQSAQSLDDFATQRTAIQKAMRLNTLRYSEGVLLQSFLTEQAQKSAERLNTEPSTRLPANNLYSRLQSQQPCLVIVDGHNLLFRLSILFFQWFEDGRPSLEAREQLTQRLLQRVMDYKSLRIELWFDGDEESSTKLHERLQVNYSGGRGKDRADRRIISSLRGFPATANTSLASPSPHAPEFGADPTALTFVVTDDLGLARRIRKTTVIPIACGEFRGFILEESPFSTKEPISKC